MKTRALNTFLILILLVSMAPAAMAACVIDDIGDQRVRYGNTYDGVQATETGCGTANWSVTTPGDVNLTINSSGFITDDSTPAQSEVGTHTIVIYAQNGTDATNNDSATFSYIVTGYNPTYVSADLDNVVADFLGTYLAQIVAFAALIALAGLYVWFRRKTPMRM